ncbi:nucleotidyltransferase family protein [Colwellia psychrerythraea]|uniref:MobA-like NTP transferase domain containing protein n=1 Tax=Colwellia psychrerythraea TaxID=28229 RepID=A0A099L3D8_COLPS|nr:nucleotidyltransferase family protein [Colwellia psychrerythraea]KGJ97381.1 MobA-like NTP transferase domain containing protein [Colwellia psychrerythraea]
MQINLILLAAGKGQRYQASTSGQVGCATIKQLADIGGKPMIVDRVEKLKPLLINPDINNIYVTLGANKNVIKAVLPQDISVIDSQHWSQGMGHSLAESVQSIKAQSSHVLIALADQAMISTEHYQNLLSASKKQPNKIIATLCDEQLMAPAIFPEKYFPLLIKLQGNKGAGLLLKSHALQTDAIACTTAKFDINTLADLEQIRQQLDHSKQENNLHQNTPSHCQNLEPV